MKNLIAHKTNVFSPLLALLFATSMVVMSCSKDDAMLDVDAPMDMDYQKVHLVSSEDGYGASVVDPRLVNAWGMVVEPTGNYWISSTDQDLTTIYDYKGMISTLPITIPGKPTGIVYNPTVGFAIPSTAMLSKIIYVGEEGTLHAWTSGKAIAKVIDQSAQGAVYTGVAIASDGESNFLYIANFSQGVIDVLDHNFTFREGKSFVDPSIPTGYAPFNIQNIRGKLYVTYAMQSGDKHDAVPGAGHGYINIFNPDGTLVKRFASQGNLNSPWGIAITTENFGEESNSILIANFGDGRINVFSEDGDFIHPLNDGGIPIEIDGLRSIMFPTAGVPSIEQTKLYFTAGPSNETQGLFGYIKGR